MRPSKTVRSGICGMAAMVVASMLAAGLEPPQKLIEELGAEAYPDRVAAEKALQAWAESGGEAANRWLLGEHRSSDNPEIRRRALSVLKSVVLKELTRERPGFVGIGMASVKLSDANGGEGYGVEVQLVNPGTPAEKAGLRVTDVIIKLNGKGWTKADAPHEFAGRIEDMRAGDKVQLEIRRDGKKEDIELVLASRPWSAGLYSQNVPLRGDPFAARRRPPIDERQAESEAFQAWIEDQQTPAPAR